MWRGNGRRDMGGERGGAWLEPKDIRAQPQEVIPLARTVGVSFEGGLPDKAKQEGSLQFAKDCLK